MPDLDKTEPRGLGSRTGRGLGPCERGFGFRRGLERGFGRRYLERCPVVETITLTKEEQKKILEAELKDIESEKKEIEQKLKELK